MTTAAAMVRNHSVSTLVVHAVWATEGRANLLASSADDWLAQELRRKSIELGAALLAVGNAADHVHVVVQHSPRIAVAELVGRLKGASSRAAHVSGVLSRGVGWQVGYWAESVGAADLQPLLGYVSHQRAHHATHGSPEPWEQDLPG
jgi:putative transposase